MVFYLTKNVKMIPVTKGPSIGFAVFGAYGVEGLVFWAYIGFRVQGLGFRVKGLGFRV